ncbi:hypothetical protein [Roseomonas sp. KE0001]|uniref:hypothetical protein n=1 Tax=Roseomonas sp. KE0001 TaxID=2479201 RepID=UPI0018DF08B8|nr:hypothetical protein [Roseomonas sp. KE0001]
MATQNRAGANIPNGVQTSDTVPSTLPEIGIPSQRASEMKRLAEAGEDRIRAEVDAATTPAKDQSRRPLTI